MRIGVNSRMYLNPGTGIPNYIKSLYEAILRLDSKNDYIFFQPNDSVKIGRTKICSTIPGNVGNFYFDNYLVHKLAHENDVDIFHGPANLLPFFKNKRTKYIVTIHDLSFLKFPKNDSLFFYWYYRTFIKRTLKSADIVVADSRSTKQDVINFYNIIEKKIKVIYLGVNPIYFDPQKKTPLIREKYFLSVTTHPKRKNIYSVLIGLYQMEKLRKYKYVIAGLMSEGAKKELDEKIAELHLQENVIVFGYATEGELKNLYQNAEFFIFPSFYEGFGLPVLEAMACRCPTICSNTSSLTEIVTDKNFLLNPYDQENINKKMGELITMSSLQKRKLIHNNYECAKRYTWEKTAQKMLGVFENLKK